MTIAIFIGAVTTVTFIKITDVLQMICHLDNRTLRKGSEKKMKSTIKKIKQQQTIQPTKITKNRITALVLALLLATTVLSPIIPVKAQETTAEITEIGENNYNDTPTIETNGDGTRTLKFSQGVYLTSEEDGSVIASWFRDHTAKGKGNFIVIGYYLTNEPDDAFSFHSYLLSNESFTLSTVHTGTINGTMDTPSTVNEPCNYYNGVYYATLHSLSSSGKNYRFYSYGLINERKTDIYPYKDALKADIDNGNIDLSKDDYMSEDDIANMKPVRDPSIGYLPRARYFDDRKKNSSLNTVTSTIQWDSFVEPYSTDLENPYYVEIYVKLHYKLGSEKNPYIVKLSQFKKYGEIKYVSERLEFSYYNAIDTYLSSIGAHFYLPAENPNVNPDMRVISRYVSDYYVRLVHYDYEKQQVLCGGFTKITPNENGGCTTETGDFPDDNPNDDDDFVSDGDDPDEWDDTGWEPNPNPDDPDNPDTPDFGIDTSSIGAFIVSAITSFLNAFKSILSLVGEFPELCKHVFSFLPEEVSTLMFGGVAAIIIMRFLGR